MSMVIPVINLATSLSLRTKFNNQCQPMTFQLFFKYFLLTVIRNLNMLVFDFIKIYNCPYRN